MASEFLFVSSWRKEVKKWFDIVPFAGECSQWQLPTSNFFPVFFCCFLSNIPLHRSAFSSSRSRRVRLVQVDGFIASSSSGPKWERLDSAMSDWNMKTQRKDLKNGWAHLTVPAPAPARRWHQLEPRIGCRWGQTICSVASVIPSVVLLLGYLSNNSLQLFARLLLVLQKLFHPLILLQN